MNIFKRIFYRTFLFNFWYNFVLGKHYLPDGNGGWIVHYHPLGLRYIINNYTWYGWWDKNGLRKITQLQWHKFPLNIIKKIIIKFKTYG